MTDNNICGSTDTNSGEPCQTPAYLCEWHDDGPQPDGGRPSKINECWDSIMEAAEAGLKKAGIARTAGVDPATLRRWEDRHDDFCAALKRARAKGELEHVRDPDDSGHSRFILERSFGYTKTEKREVDLDADHTVDAEEGVSAEFVTYEPEDDGSE